MQALEQPTLEEGLALKERGMALVDLAEPEDWKQRANGAIRYLAGMEVSFTAEDVRELVGDPDRPNAMGSRLSAAARAGVIRCVGYTTATRASRHASVQKVWVGA